MFELSVHCIEVPGHHRRELYGHIERVGTSGAPTYLCQLFDSAGVLAIMGRLDDAPREHEAPTSLAARCIAEALVPRPRIEPMGKTGRGTIVLRKAGVDVYRTGFTFTGDRLFTDVDPDRGVHLAGVHSYWQLAELVLFNASAGAA